MTNLFDILKNIFSWLVQIYIFIYIETLTRSRHGHWLFNYKECGEPLLFQNCTFIVVICMIFTISVPPPPPTTTVRPCTPSPCGLNALCTVRNGAASCRCLENYFGDPYQACQPECLVNNDCTATTACRNLHCVDPCPGLCGVNAGCKVINHIPTCTCLEGYQGDPFTSCRLRPLSKNLTI